MTRLDAIKGRAQMATEGCTAGTPADYAFIRHAYADIPWLLNQVEALVGTLQLIAAMTTGGGWSPSYIRNIARDAQGVARETLAALEAPNA